MCGIVGYVGTKKVAPLLLEGLKNLEYGGYDSAGISTISNNNIIKKKDVGKIEEVDKKLSLSELDGNIGIAHTYHSFQASSKFFLKEKGLSYRSKGITDSKINSHFQKFRDIPTKESMNILNFIKFENYYCQINTLFQKSLKEKISNYSEIARKIDVSRMTVFRISNIRNYWINFRTLLNISKLFNIPKKEVYKNIRNIKTHNSFPILFNIKNLISPAFFRIIGHILGDGGIHVIKNEGKYRAFYSNKRHELINSFGKDIIYLFGKIRIYKRMQKRQVKEIWLPTSLGYLFYEFMEYQKYGMKRIPSFVYKVQNSKLLGYLLQALYDDEGFIYPQKHMIVISQKSRILVNDIREVMKKLDIKPNPILIHKTNNRTTMYYFSITGKENILSFAKKIGFLHPVKKKKLEVLTEKYRGM